MTNYPKLPALPPHDDLKLGALGMEHPLYSAATLQEYARAAVAADRDRDQHLEKLEREHFGDPDKQTGIYAPRPVAWRTRWGDGEWSYTDDGEPNRIEGREVQALYAPGVKGCAPTHRFTNKQIEEIAGTDELTGDAILDFAHRLLNVAYGVMASQVAQPVDGQSGSDWELIGHFQHDEYNGWRQVQSANANDYGLTPLYRKRADLRHGLPETTHKPVNPADGVAPSQAPEQPLPYWEPCNPGCDPEFNGQRDRHCAKLCKNARDALGVAIPLEDTTK